MTEFPTPKSKSLDALPLESPTNPSATPEQIAEAAAVLELIVADRGLLDSLTAEERQRLVRAAGRVSAPTRQERKQLLRAKRKREQKEASARRAADRELLGETGIRAALSTRQRKRPHPPAPTEIEPVRLLAENASAKGANGPTQQLNAPRCCYICKQDYERLHEFYDSMCPACAELNWTRRNQTADLTGRYVLVTGGRVKIGYQAALKLLRAGAHVVVSTRFPCDGAGRFAEEEDYEQWSDRLQIHGLDLRHTPSVEAFADHLCQTLPRLDFLLNNACQTVRRPPGFYAHLIEAERQLSCSLSDAARPLLASYEALCNRGQNQSAPDQAKKNGRDLSPQVDESLAGIRRAAELSQLALVAGDEDRGGEIFPAGQYDQDQQQIDLRSVNSWRLRLAEVSTVELLEVQLVNAIAPFILNARLKPLMLRVPTNDKHIVNVSAMEGVFYRAYKTDKHPHTNMAKAALNMLTRTSAADYVADGIYMNSVDTGWITDEDPIEITLRKQEELDFHPPLDVVDAAARICDPIFQGFLTGQHAWGQFFKDYKVANW